ncbi:MAG: polysaccharide deacetylase [Sphingomonadaceae bacterium]
MATRVLLTVDTEFARRHAAGGSAPWREVFARSCEAAGVGIPFQLELLRRHRLKATFFVDPLPALVYGLAPVRAMVEPILEAGQEIGLHLHPFWKGLARGREDRRELADFPPAAQREMLATARDLLIEAGAPAPIAFRAGSYAASRATLELLPAFGIRYDSSHNGCYHPRPCAVPLDPACIAPRRLAGIVEVPVTQIEAPGGALRHLQFCAVSAREMRAALAHAAAGDHPVAVLVGHGFELARRDGLAEKPPIRRRFERLCAWLEERSDELPTARFAELGDLPLDADAVPYAAGPAMVARRMAAQLVADAVYERRA